MGGFDAEIAARVIHGWKPLGLGEDDEAEYLGNNGTMDDIGLDRSARNGQRPGGSSR